MDRAAPTMTINRVIEAMRMEQVKDDMAGQCIFALATPRSATTSGERVGAGTIHWLAPAVAAIPNNPTVGTEPCSPASGRTR